MMLLYPTKTGDCPSSSSSLPPQKEFADQSEARSWISTTSIRCPVQFSPACPSDGLIPVPLLLSSLMMNQEDWNCTLKKSFAQWAKFTRSLFQFCNVYEELNIEQKVQNHHCYANILLILVWVNNSWVLLIWSNVKSIYLI